MSAFIVSDAHIDYLVSAAFAWRREVNNDLYEQAEQNRLASMLKWANKVSVDYRYEGSKVYSPEEIASVDRVPRLTYALKGRGVLEMSKILKAIDCFEYQSCEIPEWEASPAFKFCERLRSAVISSLPGYEDAPWGIDD